jgi:hypothetical protein
MTEREPSSIHYFQHYLAALPVLVAFNVASLDTWEAKLSLRCGGRSAARFVSGSAIWGIGFAWSNQKNWPYTKTYKKRCVW